MLRRGTHRIVIALALAAALLAPAASLAAGPYGPAHASSWRLDLDALWTWGHLWLGLPNSPTTPAKPTQKTACDGGSSIDPNGHTVCKSAPGASSDAGLHIAPDG